MSVIINASTTSGLVMSSDLSGNLQFQNNGVNLPMGGVAPAFSAYLNTNQTITGSTFTKVTFDIEDFDTNNNFASSRFTPTVAGYYQVNGKFDAQASVGGVTRCILSIYKNGSGYRRGIDTNGTVAFTSVVSDVVYLNGSTDYIELYGYITAGTTAIINSGSNLTFFSACLVRGA
jgi:hypothetical protein